ncbi:MAG: molybdopterin-dependent oxidoreductase [Spirochaetota bacterium]|nr:MAG: molybdopterin-dependent oxidoreductase [Spirochaetota bacterium]
MITLPVSCNKDCGGGCPLLAHIDKDRLVKITNNPFRNPYQTGCVRGYQMPRAVYSKDRLKRPLIRNGPRGSGKFREVLWEEALDLVSRKLLEAKEEHGEGAILPLGGSGSCTGAVHNTALLKDRFFGLLGRCTRVVGDYSEHAVEFVKQYLFGKAHTGLDPGTLQFSNLIILWGANIADTRFGCEMLLRVREAKKGGVPVIVIDPRRTATVSQIGSQWIPVLPGTDSILMAAVLWVLMDEELIDRDSVKSLSYGFDHLEGYIKGKEDGQPKTPEWAEGVCRTPKDVIRRFAKAYGTTKPAALIPGLSIQRTWGGEEPSRMAVVLQVATGNIGARGGSTGSNVLNKLPYPKCGTIKLKQGTKGTPIQVYRWPDAVIEGKNGGYPSDIQILYFVGCNFLNQGSDIHKNIQAFNKADFSVCHDYFLTPTARYCDVVLPVTTFLEREDIIFPRSNHLFYSHKVIEPLYESRNDYDIFCELADRAGFLKRYTENRTADEWVAYLLKRSEVEDIEQFKKTGIYEGKDNLRTGLADFASDPVEYPLNTPSGRIEIYSEKYKETGFSPYPVYRVLPADNEFPLRLVTPHARLRIHSQNYNIPWFRDRQDDRLWMHPIDAKKRGIIDGDKVIVKSRQGSMKIEVLVTEDIMSGVVSACEGVWPSFDEDGTEINGSVNMLTSTDPTEPSMGSRTHSVLVEVSAGAIDRDGG